MEVLIFENLNNNNKEGMIILLIHCLIKCKMMETVLKTVIFRIVLYQQLLV